MKNDDVIKRYRSLFTSKEESNKTEGGIPFTDYWKTKEIEEFWLAEIKRAREEVLEEVKKIIAESEKKHLQGGFCDDGGVVKSMQTELNKLGKLASKEEL